MLWTIAVLLLLLWLVGMVSSYTLGGFIHILLLLAIAAILIRVIQGRRPVVSRSHTSKHERPASDGGGPSCVRFRATA